MGGEEQVRKLEVPGTKEVPPYVLLTLPKCRNMWYRCMGIRMPWCQHEGSMNHARGCTFRVASQAAKVYMS